MNLNHIFIVYFKELRDAVRDRRTLLSTLLLPTLGVPVVMGIVALVTSQAVKKTQQELPTVAIVGAAESPKIRDAMRAAGSFKVVDTPDDWAKQISDKKLRAAVEIAPDFDQRLVSGNTSAVRIRHYEGELASKFAVQALEHFFEDYRRKVVADRLRERDVPPAVIEPFSIQSINVAPPEKVGGNMLGGILPYLALIGCFVGAMHPAMDLTAGEKERGTLETILSTPVKRVDLVLGKFLLVLTTSLTTVICSLTSMTISLHVITTKMAGKAPAAEAGAEAAKGAVAATLNLWGVLGCAGLILPVAVLSSAFVLAVSIAAKSMKEAQSYIAPMMFVIIIPAMISMLPGVDLNLTMALIPVLNVSLTAKQMVSGIFNWGYIAITFASCWVYAAIALAFCVRQFNRESVLFRT